jgi:hypothetical protein
MRKVSKNLIVAYNKGVKAKQEGKKISDCPYKDKRRWPINLVKSIHKSLGRWL